VLPSGDAQRRLGAAIFASGVSRVVAADIERSGSHRVADLLSGTAIPVVIISYMLKFTKACSERVTHAEASAAATP
jgi:uncharacterized protein (DUF39 family)